MRIMAIKKSDRILVVAPHPDDESIGCGGLLQKYGSQSDVLLLSNGCRSYNQAQEKVDENLLAQTRKLEFAEAMKTCGVAKTTVLGIPDREIYKNYATVRTCDVREYDYIFVTSRFEQSQDHKHAYYFLKKMVKKQRAKAVLVEYEVWTPIHEPTLVLDISDVIERKLQTIAFYRSQLKCYDYVNFALGLSLYRGGRFKKKNVEAFFIQPTHYYLKIIIRLLTTYSLREKLKALVSKLLPIEFESKDE